MILAYSNSSMGQTRLFVTQTLDFQTAFSDIVLQKPSAKFASLATLLVCSLQLRFLSMVTPK